MDWAGAGALEGKARVKHSLRMNDENVSTDTIYIGLEDVEAGSGSKPTKLKFPSIRRFNCSIFYEGDVLYGKLRPWLRKAIISEMAGCCSTEFLVLRAEKTEPRWLRMAFNPDVTH
jgi:type I restriction enzyme S subunit